MTLRHALPALALAALLAPGQGQAQTPPGPYVAAAAGLGLWHDEPRSGTRFNDRELGFTGLGALGWGFAQGFRVELEGSYHERPVINGSRRIGGGRVERYGAMLNLLYEPDLANFGLRPAVVQPYLGIGLGYLNSDVHNAWLRAGGTTARVTDSAGAFAYQARLGAAWGLQGVLPGLSLTTEYRYIGAAEARFRTTSTAAAAGTATLSSSSHAVLVGLRYAFSTAP